MNDATVLFEEVQYFRQPWLWILLIGVSLVVFGSVGVSAFKYLFVSESANPKLGLVLMIGPVILVCVNLLLLVAKLDVEVRQDGLYVGFFPFDLTPQRIEFGSLQAHTVTSFRPIRDYGGWGIRYGKNTKAYIVSGNSGVLLTFSDQKALCIGSQKPQELDDALTKMLSST